MTKYAGITICMLLTLAACSDEGTPGSPVGDIAYDNAGRERLQFSSDIPLGAPATGGNANVGTLRYAFEDNDQLGLFGIRNSLDHVPDMTNVTLREDFYFFNQAFTFQNSQPTLIGTDELYMPADNNLIIYSYYPHADDGNLRYDEQHGWVAIWQIDTDNLAATPDYMCCASPTLVKSDGEPAALSQMEHSFGAVAFRFHTDNEAIAQNYKITNIRVTIALYEEGIIALQNGEVVPTVDPTQYSSKYLDIPQAGLNIKLDDTTTPSIAYILPPGSRMTSVRAYLSDGTNKPCAGLVTVEKGKINYFDFHFYASGTRTKGSGEQLEIETSVTTEDWNESN